MTKFPPTATPTEKAAAALSEKSRRRNELLTRKLTEIIEEQYTGFADFLHECRVQGLTIDEAAELFDRQIKMGLPLFRKKVKE
jgi:hypothetical protein